MAGTTANLKIPYPTGTDRVMDGDNAMQAIAERVDARLPYGSVKRTAPQTTGIGSVKQVIDSSVIDPAFPANRLIRLSATMTGISNNAGGVIQMTIHEGSYANIPGSTELVYCDGWCAAGAGVQLFASCLIAPSAGVHTYFITATAPSTGTGSIYVSTVRPAYFMAEDIGPAVIT